MFEEDTADEITDESLGNSIIALFQSGQRIGISHYSEVTNTISLDGVNISLLEFEELIQDIKRTYRPNLFILHPRIASNASLLSMITDEGQDNEESYRYSYKVMRSSSWNVEAAIETLINRVVIKDITQGHNSDSRQSGQEKYIAVASGETIGIILYPYKSYSLYFCMA